MVQIPCCKQRGCEFSTCVIRDLIYYIDGHTLSVGRVLYWFLFRASYQRVWREENRAKNLKCRRILSTRLVSTQTRACQSTHSPYIITVSTDVMHTIPTSVAHSVIGTWGGSTFTLRSVPDLRHDLGFRRRLQAILAE